jgi:amino acid transporter
MQNKWTALLMMCLLCFTCSLTMGQENAPAQMADTMRSNGKIYVVIAVILTILIGLILYLVRLDRKISKLEQSGKH